MAAGLPGTGIGGLFFILSAFFMIIVELQRTIRGKSSLARWRIVGRHATVAATMVVAVTAAIWLVHRLVFTAAHKAGDASGKTSSSVAHELVPFSPVLITLGVLLLVLLTSYLAKFVFGRRTTSGRLDTPGGSQIRSPQPALLAPSVISHLPRPSRGRTTLRPTATADRKSMRPSTSATPTSTRATR